MSYISLYRKYRSQSFGELAGQDHVTTVLRNAITMGRISHAYLFCGPRGCGKTSTARLLARALNCLSSDGPTPDPCGTCDMCVAIRDGSAMDVIEMDAASETGIDDVREKIIENAKFAPTSARFKVYIIDEVHDLSLKAFDSLLKTIEEPPAHVTFILATTEAHKVPMTVRSRCQRLDFRRGTLDDLGANLRRVLDSEQISYDAEAVSAVARAAEGSFRDSLSILEQVLAYTDGGLSADAVHCAIGTVGPELLDEVTHILADDDMSAAFLKAGELVDTGKDVRQTIIALQNHLRDLMVASVSKNPQSIPDVTAERFAALKAQAARFSSFQILRMLDVLAEAERDLRFTNQHRLLLEKAFWSILPSAINAQPKLEPVTVGAAGAPSRQRTESSGHAITRQIEPRTESAPVEQALDPAASIRDGAVDLDGIRRIWPRVLKRVTDEAASASAYLSGALVLGLEGAHVVLGFPDKLWLERVERPKARALVEKAFTDELRIGGIKIRCRLTEDTQTRVDSVGNGSLEFNAAAAEHSGNGDAKVDATANAQSDSTDEASILNAEVKAEFGDRLVPE